MHPIGLRYESSEYPDIPALSRLARRAPHRLKIVKLFFREPLPLFHVQTEASNPVETDITGRRCPVAEGDFVYVDQG